MGLWALFMAPLPRCRAERADKNTHLPDFPWKGFNCNFLRCCLRVRLLISLHLAADVTPLWSLKIVGSSLTFFLGLAPKIKPSLQLLPERNLPTHVEPQLCSCHPRDGPLHHLAMRANVVCIHECHSNILNKRAEKQLKLVHKHFLQLSSLGSAQIEQVKTSKC